MQIIIRPYEQSDKADVCKLLNQTSNVPLGEDMFEMQEARIRTYPFYKRIVFTVNNEVVGMAQLLHATGMTPQGFLSQTIIVDAAHRGRGYGQMLDEALALWMQEEQPIGLQTTVRDNNPEARAWAERRGFMLKSHQFESVLDLTSFPLETIDTGIRASEAHGITFRTFEHFSLEDDMERLYQIVKQLSGDTPDSQGALDFPFETFAAMVRRMDPRNIFIAMAGEEIAGITCLVSQGNEMYTLFTGVVKEYRGKGIAYTLKLLSIRFAHASGVKQLRTNNHSTNAPMLAVNRKLGYESQPGNWILKRS